MFKYLCKHLPVRRLLIETRLRDCLVLVPRKGVQDRNKRHLAIVSSVNNTVSTAEVV
jgi:hypothetical protein